MTLASEVPGARPDLTIALWQHAPHDDPKTALRALDAAAATARAGGATLLVTPECSLTGYDIPTSLAEERAFTASGEHATQVAELAARHGIAMLYGYMESVEKHRFNAVQLVDGNGAVRLDYRKAHLWQSLDRRLFSAGDTLGPVIELDGWRLGALICYDVEFPEAVRALAVDGADLVLVPTALMQPWHFVASHVTAVRAAENGVFLAYANRVGQEANTVYEGRSCIVAPDGTSLASAPPGDETLLFARLEHAELARVRTSVPYLSDRREALYR